MATPVEGLERRRSSPRRTGWIGTPYHHAADVKEIGVDCAMLLVRVFCNLGLSSRFTPDRTPGIGCCTATTSANWGSFSPARAWSKRRALAT